MVLFLKTYYPKEFIAASMTMDISNQNKLSEFYEELKRLNIAIERPNINKCYANFRSNNNIFYYALGAIKNVGFEAVANIVKERDKNGIFKSLGDFINRVNPKDINKLQLEGLVKAGALDDFLDNRQSIYNSIPNIILKSKNIFENKIANQIDLFGSSNEKSENFLEKIDDWIFEERLSKEFESIGFFISNHPLNQYKEIFDDYKISNFNEFNLNKDIKDANVAATLLKLQEKKTQKGNSYAIVRFSDLTSVFELFIFSDLLEANRTIIKEGQSLIITVSKNEIEESNRFKKFTVKKISHLSSLINKPIENIEIFINNDNFLEKVEKILYKPGKTNVKIKIIDNQNKYIFNLKNKRYVDRTHIDLLKNQGITANII